MVVLVAIISQILFLSTFVVLNITAYIKAICSFLRKYFVVGEKGLEPLTLAGLVPKTSVSTNCTTRPYSYYILSTENRAEILFYDLKFECAPARSRTSDHLLKRELLYQLSYGRVQKDDSKNSR